MFFLTSLPDSLLLRPQTVENTLHDGPGFLFPCACKFYIRSFFLSFGEVLCCLEVCCMSEVVNVQDTQLRLDLTVLYW